MKTHPRSPWLSESRVDGLIALEPCLMLVAGALAMWVLYTVALRKVNAERHKSLRHELANLTLHTGMFGGLALAYFSLDLDWFVQFAFGGLRPWLGLLVLVQGATTFVKTLKILFTQLLFLGHMREGVPALLINTFTAVVALLTGGWLAARLFDLHFAPLLATSAVASVILGLAMQDSLGNLFAGIAMQIDKPYEIGDWVEVVGLTGKWSGQVHEVTWRATVLVGLFDESIVIPNRVVGQGQVYNFTQRGTPILRSQSFHVPVSHDLEAVRKVAQGALRGIDGIAQEPAPVVLFGEIGEGWVLARCNYWVADYGAQWRVGDAVITSVIGALKANELHLAVQQIQVSAPPAEAE
ncbi:MAG: mechanosensitive ion channel family protein [Deltaproteobacteria bacterium]|nr:mechanosensitive ion channel family protein [Deltaproteobacteria bacterium]